MALELFASQVQSVCGERLLDFLDRLLAEVRNRGELVLGLRDEIADRLDADALEAVVRADAELELLDREVLHPVRRRRLRTGRLCGSPAEALDPVEIGEDRELADQDLRGLPDRVTGLDRAVRGHVEAKVFLVGALAAPRGLDVV